MPHYNIQLFLQALGSAILNSLWQCFILWLVYETISVSYKSASARFKNNLSTLLLFLSFAWFLASLVSIKFSISQTWLSVAVLSKDFVVEPQSRYPCGFRFQHIFILCIGIAALSFCCLYFSFNFSYFQAFCRLPVCLFYFQ